MFTIFVARLENMSSEKYGARVQATTYFPKNGQTIKFVPKDGKPIVDGCYLVAGMRETGSLNGGTWARVVGEARPVALADSENVMNALIAQIGKALSGK